MAAILAVDDRNILDYVNRSLDEEEEFHFLRFEGLQRINIIQLQNRLTQLKRAAQARTLAAGDYDELKNSLRDYCNAIRDYQFLRNKRGLSMSEETKRQKLLERYFAQPTDLGPMNPFASHYSRFEDADEKLDPLRAMLMRHLPTRLSYSPQERKEREREFREGKPPKEVSVVVDRTVRLVIALSGGAFLVIPMIIMALGQALIKSLVTVSVAVILFALILSFMVRVSNVETLVSTATYAAVLVVFVGTTSNSSGSSSS